MTLFTAQIVLIFGNLPKLRLLMHAIAFSKISKNPLFFNISQSYLIFFSFIILCLFFLFRAWSLFVTRQKNAEFTQETDGCFLPLMRDGAAIKHRLLLPDTSSPDSCGGHAALPAGPCIMLLLFLRTWTS